MDRIEIDLRAIERGTVTAPVGCGKTHLIAHALAGHWGNKPILVLTHTNAGVAALRGRLDRAGDQSAPIDWARSMAGPSGSSRPFLAAAPTIRRFCGWLVPARDYPAIRDAAWKLLQAERSMRC